MFESEEVWTFILDGLLFLIWIDLHVDFDEDYLKKFVVVASYKIDFCVSLLATGLPIICICSNMIPIRLHPCWCRTDQIIEFVCLFS